MVDMNTHEVAWFPSPPGQYRETILSVNKEPLRVWTLQRKTDGYELRTRTFDGDVLSSLNIPFFRSDYMNDVGHALGPRGDRIAFYDRPSQGIALLDIASDKVDILVKQVASSSVPIKRILWISEEDILVLLDSDRKASRETSLLLHINVPQKTKASVYESDVFARDIIFSQTASAVACWGLLRKTSKDEVCSLVLLDSRSFRTLAEIREGEIIRAAAWSPDGQLLAYAVGKRGVSVYSRKTEESTPIFEEQGDRTCYNVGFTGPSQLTCVFSNQKKTASRMLSLDVSSGRVLHDNAIPGRVDRIEFMSDPGKVLFEVRPY